MNSRYYKKRGFIVVIILVFLSSLGFISMVTLKNVKLRQMGDALANLLVISRNTHLNVRNIWVKGYVTDTTTWAEESVIVKNTKILLKQKRSKKSLLNSLALKRLRIYFQDILKLHGVRGLAIISPDLLNLASIRDNNVGRTNVIVKKYKHRLDQALQGKPLIIPPIRSNVPLPDQRGEMQNGYPTMFVVVPIKDVGGKIIALLSLRLDPFGDFSLLAQSMGLGHTGEVYIFDRKGYMLSERSSHKKRVEFDFINDNNLHYMLNVKLHIPTIKSNKPKLVNYPRRVGGEREIIRQTPHGKEGVISTIYNDYRGVPVFGAWTWDEDLEMGFLAKIDEDEVLATYFLAENIALFLLIITLALCLCFTYFILRIIVKNNREVEASEKYLQAILDNTIDSIITADREGVIQSFNVAAENLLGYRSSEVVGQNISLLVPDILQRRNKNLMEKMLSVKKVRATGLQLEGLLQHKSGEMIPIRFASNIMVLKGQDYFVGIIQDLRNKKESERALQESETQFKETFSNAPIGIASLSWQGNFIKVNSHLCSLFGYSEAEFLSMSYKDVQQEATDVSMPILKKIKKQDLNSSSFENEYLTKEGKHFWGIVTLTVIKKRGKNDSLIAVFEDITVRKLANNQLKIRTEELENSNRSLEQSRLAALSVMQDANLQKERAEQTLVELEQRTLELNKLSRAIEQSSSIVVVTDKKGLIEYVNPSFTKITGYSVERVIGQNPRLLNSGFHSDDFFKNLWDSILAGNVWHGEIMNKKEDGELYWENTSISPIFNEEGEITHFVAVKDDITQQKIVDQELRKAKEAAESATKAKSNFLASMSHEIRTPMNAIIGMIYLLSKTSLTDKQRNYILKIDYSAKNLLIIINDILDFSKIEAGKLDININPFNLYEMVESLIAVNSVRAEEKGLDLVLKTQEDLPTVLLGDSLRIGQIIINLIHNSVKFTDKGVIEVALEREREDANSITIKFSVKDSGIGITKAQSKELFRPFTQADSSTTRKYGGTGLGLSICRNLTNLMGGEIWVESEIGEGSVFSFRLKLQKTKFSPIVSSNLDNNKNLADIAGSTILLVEDNLISQEVAQALLDRYSFNIITVNNGQEAVDLIFEGEIKFDLVLMDLRMPVMDGIEATNLIRKNDLYKELKIIAMTADAMQGVRKKTLTQGMNDYISKPIDPQFLEELLLKWIIPKRQNLSKRGDESSSSLKDDSEEIIFPELPGISLESGLMFVDGNKELYRKILFSFYNEYQDIAKRVKNALAKGAYKLGLSLVHSLKGVAGTIGAKDLMTVSSKFQSALTKKDKDIIPQLTEDLFSESQIVLDGLRLFVEKKETSNNGNLKWDINLVLITLKELQGYLRENKPRQSKDLIADLNKYDWPEEYKNYFGDIIKFVDVYQFKQAEDVLDILFGKINL